MFLTIISICRKMATVHKERPTQNVQTHGCSSQERGQCREKGKRRSTEGAQAQELEQEFVERSRFPGNLD